MPKLLHVAWREFISTVATKGFVVGVLITPVIIGMVLLLMPLLFDEAPPPIAGEVAVVDPTGEIFPRIEEYLRPDAIARRREAFLGQVSEAAPAIGQFPGFGKDAGQRAVEALVGRVPQLQLARLADEVDLELEKASLLAQAGSRLALIVVADDAVVREEGKTSFGSYELFVRQKLDDRIQNEIRDGLREAIVDARVEAQGLERSEIEALTRVRWRRSTTVTAEGERESTEFLNALLPAAYMILLLLSVMVSGQYIMTTTIEEKSSRVVEMLLSAVSPMELMTGKILGQLGVGLVVLALYGAIGIGALISFALVGLVDMVLLLYLFIFYLISFFVIASLMAAIGAAVNELREAQTLLAPVMVTVMIPWILWMPISRNPNSTLAVTASFLPPINPFVMLLRMTSATPPPWWQIWLSIAVGLASVYLALWFAAKVFRVGLLMHGKPPSFVTLLRWVRMA